MVFECRDNFALQVPQHHIGSKEAQKPLDVVKKDKSVRRGEVGIAHSGHGEVPYLAVSSFRLVGSFVLYVQYLLGMGKADLGNIRRIIRRRL